MFSTDGQTGVEIGVYQGKRTLVKDNKHIGQFKLSYPARTKGDSTIAVSFEIDADGINVSATDKTHQRDLEHYGNVAIQVTEVGLTDAEVENDPRRNRDERKRLAC